MKIFYGKLQFGDNHILLEIDDEELIIFVEKEYLYRNYAGNINKGISLSVRSSASGLSYTFKKDGLVKQKIELPKTSDTPYKEFILQGMIELCLFDAGIFFMHASSFVERERLHVFLGPSGSGKTTILKRLNPKKITSNDTIALIYNDEGSGVDVVYPSPFDKKTYGRVKEKTISVQEIYFYSLKQARKNAIGPLLLYEKMELLVQNMNMYMFSVQKDVTRKPELKRILQEEAVKKAFFLSRFTIQKLSFNKGITNTDFMQIQQ